MEKEFVPYEPSLALKELGFDEPCLAWFAETKKLQIAPETYKKWTSKPCNNSNIINEFNVDCITAPTFSQAFRFFREKYKIHSIINLTIIGTWYFELYDLNDKRNAEIKTNQNEFETPEEAELACLIELIEIVKNK